MRSTRKFVVALVFALVLLVGVGSMQTPAFADSTTVSCKTFGLEISFPSKRFDIKRCNEPDPKKEKRQAIAFVNDSENVAHMSFFTHKASGTLSEWTDNLSDNAFFPWYAGSSVHSVNKRENRDDRHGNIVFSVREYEVIINGNFRRVAFASFAHNGHYLALVAYNYRTTDSGVFEIIKNTLASMKIIPNS